MAPWYTGPIHPPITHGDVEFWLDEELQLTVQTDDVIFIPSEGMYVTYKNLEGVEETFRVGDVTLRLETSETGVVPANPPDPAVPGSIVLRPTIKIVMQPVV